MDGIAFGEEVVGLVRGFVEREFAPLKAENEELKARIKALEDRPAPEVVKGEPGENGQDGVSPEPEAVAAALLPIAEDMITKAVATAVSELPPPEKGEKGEAGDQGEKGEAGADGKDGADGRGIKDLLVDRDGHLIATMDDGTTKDLGPIIGKDGEPGKDGQDGFGLDDFDCTPIDERTIKMEFVRGEVKHSYELQFPVVVYRGVFKDGDDYERGDMVTWGGSLWHCDTPTKDKPGTDSWTLAAKKGRDGKDAKIG